MIKSERSHVYLILSDIHADVQALNSIIGIMNDPAFKKRYGSVDKIINLGDTMGRGYNPVGVIERLMGLGKVINLVSIMGNHDESFLYDLPVSRDDEDCIRVHKEFKNTAISGSHLQKACLDFLKNLPQYYADKEEKILAVHGGTLDPEKIAPSGPEDYDKWLYQMTWQRISEHDFEYLDDSGYHYLPENAFLHTREFFDNGFIIFCGHQHTEAVYRNKGMKTELISDDCMKVRMEEFARRMVQVKELERERTANYLIRVGIAGPAGYYKRYGWNKTHFGLLWREKGTQKVGLFNTNVNRKNRQ
ncbi:MAG TPA: metallophosphoesterase [Candidatus Methanoperedens sp.]